MHDYLPSLLYKSLFIFQPFFVLSVATLACDTASGISQCLVFYALACKQTVGWFQKDAKPSANKHLRTEKSISRWYIKIEFDSQNNILVDKFLKRFCFGRISLVKKAVVILVSIPVSFSDLKFFFIFYCCIIFSFKFSNCNWKCQVSDVLKVLSCIVLSVHRTLILPLIDLRYF